VHTIAPRSAPKKPAEHGRHSDEPTAGAKRPTGQNSHLVVESALEKEPSGHGPHVPFWSRTWPAPHGVATGEHEADPTPLVVPDGQAAQSTLPTTGEKVPAGQALHTLWPPEVPK
jgi:hypothetical protein